MNIREALQWARSRLPASPTPHEDARLLLQHVLRAGHAYLAAHPEQALSAAQEEAYRALMARAARLEPIPYLTGEASFGGLDFIVTPDVLIPRPETELLIEAAVSWAQDNGARSVIDVGTGSGCIAVLLAKRLPEAIILAVDVSDAALNIARQNVQRHDVASRIHLKQNSLLQGLDGPFDLIVANLPYITDAEWTVLDDGVKWYEPAGALRGGPDGLDLFHDLLQQAIPLLRRSGAIFLEIGWQQGQAARQMAHRYFPTARIELKHDYAGHDRLVIIETANE